MLILRLPTKHKIKIFQEATNLFGFSKPVEVKKAEIKGEEYKVPDNRACGRPHNTGWLELLGDEEMGVGAVPADPEDSVYEADNWREIIANRQRIGNRQ